MCPASYEEGNGIATDELVQYYLVNLDLPLSAGKLAAQVAHAATYLASSIYHLPDSTDVGPLLTPADLRDMWEVWYHGSMTKVVLGAHATRLQALLSTPGPYRAVYDEGRTEVPQGSLTVVGLYPLPRNVARAYVKRAQLYVGPHLVP